jgi:Na+(H+)/acetate symporter ActP
MVALFAVALSELARLAPDNVDVAGPVFGACATFAALFLPAAGLVNQYATIRLPDLAKDLVLHKTDQSHVVAVNKIVARVLGAVRGLPVCFVMFVVALAFATFALFHPDLVLLHWRYAILQVSLENILIGLASTLDLAAACKLLPLAFVLLDRANLQAVYDGAVGLQSVKAEEEEEEEKKEEEEAKKQTPSAQPQAGSPS